MTELNGGDISHWNAGLDLGMTGWDFAIMKATDGTSFVDDHCDRFVNQAKKAGMHYGVYHFAERGGSGEADYFVDHITGYLGHALLALDWEAGAISYGPGAAKAFLDRVEQRTGIRPMLYTSQSVAASENWSAVAKDTALWVARYASSIGDTGGWPVTMWQHTSSGHAPGYSGNLDLDTFYGAGAAWDAIAGATTTGDHTPDTPTTEDDMPEYKNEATSKHQQVPVDGVWHGIHLTDDQGLTLLEGPKYADGLLAVHVDAHKGQQILLRSAQIDFSEKKSGEAHHGPTGSETYAEGGSTQITLPFTEDIGKPGAGYDSRRLRFQIQVLGSGGAATITHAAARTLYWSK